MKNRFLNLNMQNSRVSADRRRVIFIHIEKDKNLNSIYDSMFIGIFVIYILFPKAIHKININVDFLN